MNHKLYSKSIAMNWPGVSRNLLMALLILAMLVSSLAVSVAPARAEGDSTESAAAAVTCATYYKVVRGDTLYKIGLKFDIVWTKIADANNIKNPNKIYAGQTLCIPTDGDSDTTLYIKVKKYDVNIRKGPGLKYKILGILRAGDTIEVTGKSADGFWWRVICPDGKVGECYVTAGEKYTELVVLNDGQTDDDDEVIPTFNITAVVEDSSVTITTANFPKDVDFDVRMGRYGTQAVNGVYITTVNSGKGGKMKYTFHIPDSLRDRKQIAIRLESDEGYYAYNWFWNKTTK